MRSICFAKVQYNVSGQLTPMRWFNLSGGSSQTETRQYNALGQMTRLTVPGQLDLEYRFSATANDGKLVSQKNYIAGEELEYQYDTLGRLSRAETTANSGSASQWGLSWLYDGFGNRLQQNAVKGTVPTQAILVDPVTNRVQSHAFDANGSTTSTPAQGAMTYDVLDRLKTVASDTYGYPPSHLRQWKNNGAMLNLDSGAPLDQVHHVAFFVNFGYTLEMLDYPNVSGLVSTAAAAIEFGNYFSNTANIRLGVFGGHAGQSFAQAHERSLTTMETGSIGAALSGMCER